MLVSRVFRIPSLPNVLSTQMTRGFRKGFVSVRRPLAVYEADSQETDAVRSQPGIKGKRGSDFLEHQKKAIKNDYNKFLKNSLQEDIPSNGFSSFMSHHTSQKNKHRWIIMEGKRLIAEALQAGIHLNKIFYTKAQLLDDLQIPSDVIPCPVSSKEMQQWSDVVTSPGLLAVFQRPDSIGKISFPESKTPITVVCDNVRDPGNLGAILRCSAAIGCERVLLSKGCTDYWDGKVLRTAAGAHFKIPVLNHMELVHVEALLSNDSKLIIADNKVEDGKESLPYYKIDFTNYPHATVIVGGETHGISYEMEKLAKKKNADRVQIPLRNGVESLNVGTALGIILYEIDRQWQCK